MGRRMLNYRVENSALRKGSDEAQPGKPESASFNSASLLDGPIALACRHSRLDDSRLVPSHPYLYLDPSMCGREAFFWDS